MKIFFIRVCVILILVFLEVSFFNVLFSTTPAPLILIASVVAWVLIVGFSQALYMLIPLALLFDIVTMGVLGAFSLYALLLAYTTSFISRRFLVEYHGIGMVPYAFFVGIGAIGYACFNILFFQADLWSRGIDVFFDLAPVFSVSKIGFSFILGPLFFLGIYHGIDRLEKYISVITQRAMTPIK